MRFFKSKGQTLVSLKKKQINIPLTLLISVDNFLKRTDKHLNQISKKFKNKKIAVRSSSNNEDNLKTSNAGKFKTYLNIDPNNSVEVLSKIWGVIKSYKQQSNQNEVIIQEMVEHVKISGVYTTIDIHNYLPLININYDESSDTTSVTSGKNNSKTLFIFEEKIKKSKIKKFSSLINVVNKIKKISKNNILDIEFAIDKYNKVFILQARPVVIPKNKKIISRKTYLNLMLKLEKKISKLQEKNYDLLGNTNCFGVMPDWNPAEIIGTKPKPLSLSLYKELITDHIWSKNRSIYGFKSLEAHHLMTVFYGTPFIDVRVDFNSWLPESLNKKTSNKLINFYLKKLKKNKYLHDKVEFEILFTCFTLSTEDKLKKELKSFNKKEIIEIKKSLIEINRIAFFNSEKELVKLKKLKLQQSKLESSNIYSLNKIYYLIEDCKKYGTLPFAGLARCGFIAIDLLNSFVEKKILTQEEKNKFLNTIDGIATNINKDNSNKTKSNFLKKYGHLRPNTYDITSLNYREGYSRYFDNTDKKKLHKKQTFIFSKLQVSKISRFLRNNKLNINFEKLIKFIKSSIYNREYAKFVFTKSIDLIFENLIIFGKKHGINRNDLAYIDIHTILDFHYSLDNSSIVSEIKDKIKRNKKTYFDNSLIQLPETITSTNDLYYNYKSIDIGNFITQKKIHAKPFFLKKNLDLKLIKGKIIFIENADPGYDFLFSKKILGLVTKYGGQNSHMSIRAAELSLPACIGLGEAKFNQLKNQKMITLDCLNKLIY